MTHRCPQGLTVVRRISPDMPRLSLFITEHSREVLAAWEAFARDLPTAEKMDVPALRDHAHSMLHVIAADLETAQTDEERDRKAHGLLENVRERMVTAASEHGRSRAEHGFSVESTVAEFRALRASVIGLWVKQQREAGPSELEEMRRFNEAIDQAVAESLAQYTHDVEGARDRFLAVLGHDLRTPLSAILMSSHVLLREGGFSEQQGEMLTVMEQSARRMAHLINDLLDLALTRFGNSIPLHRASTDLGVLLREVVAEVSATSSAARINIETSGTLIGEWDRRRMGEALTNLLTNAIEHGSPGKTISVRASEDGDLSIAIAIANEGRAIPRNRISGLFSPMTRTADDRPDRRHLGLGLYIVSRIVEAHGGGIQVRSSDEQGTTFSITLPRHAVANPANS
jgi:signal transduction histidine kinase